MKERFNWIMLLLFVLLQSFRGNGQTPSHISLPLLQLHVNSPFGKRVHPITGQPDFHTGIDLAARCEPVLSVLDGTVYETGFNPFLGFYIRIKHGQFQSIYGHLSTITVQLGETVCAGQLIGVTGATGRVSGEHLHFSIRFRNKYLNPLHFLRLLLQADEQPININ